MMRTLFIAALFVGLAVLISSYDESSKKIDRSQLLGGWKIEKVLRPDGTLKHPEVFISVLPDGKFRSVRKGIFINHINGTWKYDSEEEVLSIKGPGVKEDFQMLELDKQKLTAKRIHTKWRKYFLVRQK